MVNHHKFCIAPMMKKTDKHFRFMARQFTKNSMLYTEMIHSNAILKGDTDKLLKFDNSESLITQMKKDCDIAKKNLQKL